MTYLVIGVTNAKVGLALMVLAIQTTIVETGGTIRQTDVPSSLAVTTTIHAKMAWLAKDLKVAGSAATLTQEESTS